MHGKYIEGLNSFNKEEDLRPVSEDSLYKLFRKSLAMDLEKRFKILEKSLSRGDFEFELANVYSSDKNIKKQKEIRLNSVWWWEWWEEKKPK